MVFASHALGEGMDRSTEVCLRLDRDDLAAFDEATGEWVVHQGTYEVLVGRSSRDPRGTARFEVSASRPAASSQASR